MALLMILIILIAIPAVKGIAPEIGEKFCLFSGSLKHSEGNASYYWVDPDQTPDGTWWCFDPLGDGSAEFTMSAF